MSPTQSVGAYRSQVLNNGQPLPRTVMQSTTPKVPYPAKTGSGAMPTGSATGIFDVMRPQNNAALNKRTSDRVKAQKAQQTQNKQQTVPTQSGGGSYSTAKGAVGARGAYNLEAGAGTRLLALQQAYKKQFGSDLPIASGGRTYQEQVALYNQWKAGKGNLAAKPGTSVHESGRAVDFGGAAHGYGKQQTWLVQNAPNFGWHWAGKNFSQVEPWHFEAMY
jgi:LAS superfamily LD-carboxypeptidase LdcB